MAKIDRLIDEWRGMSPVAWSQHAYGWILPDGAPITLAAWQRAVLATYWQHRERVSTLFISTVKKAGKTLLDSLLTCYRWLTIPTTHFVVGNDKDQSAELQFTMIRSMCERHPLLATYIASTRDVLTFEPTGSRIVSLPMDYKGAAGANFATVSITELWGFEYEFAQRLYEELTPIPGDCLRIVDSYAGYISESDTLRHVWDRGEAGEPVSDDWPILLTGQQLSYIHQGVEAQVRCWRGTDAEREAYYREQQESLRPGTYNRLHLNLWGQSEDVFVPAEMWEACLEPGLKALAPTKTVPIYVGVDCAVRPGGDDSAVIGCYRHPDTNRVAVAWCKIWKGGRRRTSELRIDQTVVPYLERQANLYNLRSVNYDPRYFTSSANQLRDKGLPMREVTQSLPVLGPVGQNLYNLIQSGELAYFNDPALKSMTAGAMAKEVTSGLHIRKGVGSVDLLVALSFACRELRHGAGVGVGLAGPEKAGSGLVQPSRWTISGRPRFHSRWNRDRHRRMRG